MILHEVLVRIRLAAGSGEISTAYQLADSFDVLPAEVARGDFEPRKFFQIYIGSLFDEHPELEKLRRLWNDMANSA